jgi:hypothetical protein
MFLFARRPSQSSPRGLSKQVRCAGAPGWQAFSGVFKATPWVRGVACSESKHGDCGGIRNQARAHCFAGGRTCWPALARPVSEDLSEQLGQSQKKAPRGAPFLGKSLRNKDFLDWWPGAESNHRHADFQCDFCSAGTRSRNLWVKQIKHLRSTQAQVLAPARPLRCQRSVRSATILGSHASQPLPANATDSRRRYAGAQRRVDRRFDQESGPTSAAGPRAGIGPLSTSTFVLVPKGATQHFARSASISKKSSQAKGRCCTARRAPRPWAEVLALARVLGTYDQCSNA